MFNHATLGFPNLYSTSLLSRPRHKCKSPHCCDDGRCADEVDESQDEPAQPPESGREVSRYFEAAQAGDEWSAKDALNKIVELNRSAHNAAGVEAWAHPPLPSRFAALLADQIGDAPDQHKEKALTRLLDKFEPSVRTLALHQLGAQLNARPGAGIRADEAGARRSPLSQGSAGEDYEPGERLSAWRTLDQGAPREARHAVSAHLVEPGEDGGAFDQLSFLREGDVPGGDTVRGPNRSRDSDLPPPDPERALRDDPPIKAPQPGGTLDPEFELHADGQICDRGRCRDARDRNETDAGMPPSVRIFEDRLIRRLYGPNASRGSLKRTFTRYHAYRNTTRFCAPSKSLKDVQRALRFWPAPQSDYDRPRWNRPVQNGDRSDLCVRPLSGWFPRSMDIRPPRCFPGGTVIHYVDEESGAVANITTDNHVLDPGYIVRWAEQSRDGCFVIHTLGRGLGRLSRFNEASGSSMFTDVDDAVVKMLGGSVVD